MMRISYRQRSATEAPTYFQKLSTRIRASWKSCAAFATFASLVFIALAPTAQAVYVEFSPSAGSATEQIVDIDVDGMSISIIDEVRSISVRGSEYAVSFSYSVSVKTIRFNDGPVMLSSVEFADSSGSALIEGADGLERVYAGAEINQFVSSVQVIGLYDAYIGITAGALVGGVNFDSVRPTNAIPEPGAALLFAAGLSAIAIRSPRQRS
jgi:hypothetical protein